MRLSAAELVAIERYCKAAAVSYPALKVVMTEDIPRLVEDLKAALECKKALELILPLAKGYAYQNMVGRNHDYINVAESALSAYEDGNGKGGER